MLRSFVGEKTTRFVDAAEYTKEHRFTAVVVHVNSHTCGASTKYPEIAEEFALTDPFCKAILSNPQSAVRTFARGQTCPEALQILRKAGRQHLDVVWFPEYVTTPTDEVPPNSMMARAPSVKP
ncbi:hypothetical protein HPB52_017078 [Rhipicephalus sanguineus]|uniref:Uncharacterized protein n=1 Tax=Rhipicephalus sanguineus TaxID=34632 RepID=A0A9D4Q246_RHISA|nr:hypothetical protein HPB52_017078 [Rhipicephalus sanguineus]